MHQSSATTQTALLTLSSTSSSLNRNNPVREDRFSSLPPCLLLCLSVPYRRRSVPRVGWSGILKHECARLSESQRFCSPDCSTLDSIHVSSIPSVFFLPLRNLSSHWCNSLLYFKLLFLYKYTVGLTIVESPVTCIGHWVIRG